MYSIVKNFMGIQANEYLDHSTQTLHENRMHLEAIPLREETKTEELLQNGKEEPVQNGNHLHIDFEDQDSEPLFHYDVFDTPPLPLTFGFALQQMLMSLSRSLSTSLLVADILCARADEALKARLLSTTMFMSGLCTLLQNTIGIRLPLYQGPTATYVVPLLALMTLPQWRCPQEGMAMNVTDNGRTVIEKVQKLEGSLMIAGCLHLLVGLTGIVGFLLRFIGPITVVPALTIMALYVYSATVRFAKAQWGITIMTVAIAIILSFYLGKRRAPVPWWSRARGFYICWSHFHNMFSILIATLVGWSLSAIITAAGGFSMDKDSPDYYARTDSRMYIVRDTDWFIFPYPGQFGPPGYDTGALVTFIMGTIGSIIDSIGDYYACVKVIDAPTPPKHAVNRGIAVEGFMSIMAGWAGAAHATSTFGGNIGAIGITRVASLSVFQLLGLLFIVMGVIGKIGAVFVTIPYSVIGGLQIINFGVLAGVMLSNLQFIDLGSKRNLTIIGMSMLVAMMMPYWVKNTTNPVDTGYKELDNTILMFLANPVFMAGILACFLDNTMPGTLEERGIRAWQSDMQTGLDKASTLNTKDAERQQKLSNILYVIPGVNRLVKRFPALGYIPVCQKYSAKLED